MRDKIRLFFLFFLSKPLPKSNNSPAAGGKRARERATADTNDKMDSLVERGYLSIPPVFETIPRTLALFVSVVISLVKRVVEERNSFLAVTTSARNAVWIDACLVFLYSVLR